MIDSTLLESLEAVRADLCKEYDRDVQLIITSGLRTESENEALAARHGWVDEGGLVARDSMHLEKHGGIAVDIFARLPCSSSYGIVPQAFLEKICRKHFVYVKADYVDGHVHCDNRGRQNRR